jgi:hypothetical protein
MENRYRPGTIVSVRGREGFSSYAPQSEAMVPTRLFGRVEAEADAGATEPAERSNTAGLLARGSEKIIIETDSPAEEAGFERQRVGAQRAFPPIKLLRRRHGQNECRW